MRGEDYFTPDPRRPRPRMAAEPTAAPPRWELAAENIAVKIRWFGLFLGYLYVNLSAGGPDRLTLNAILGLGASYTLIDTYYSLRGRVFFGRRPLAVSGME